jgi:hypothetical protein
MHLATAYAYLQSCNEIALIMNENDSLVGADIDVTRSLGGTSIPARRQSGEGKERTGWDDEVCDDKWGLIHVEGSINLVDRLLHLR